MNKGFDPVNPDSEQVVSRKPNILPQSVYRRKNGDMGHSVSVARSIRWIPTHPHKKSPYLMKDTGFPFT